ncbi:MAG: hypothetical protein II888_04380 [Clostridia bacterium]|nr:hypothetical protein [Clostridia bacterium]
MRETAGARLLRGYYGRRLVSCRHIWCWSFVLALLCTLITWPGVWYSDSYVRVNTGNAILNTLINLLHGRRVPLETDNAFSVLPSFFMALSIGLTGHVSLYTFLQAFAFFAAAFLLIREVNPEHRILQSVLLACCPLIYGVSVYYEAGIGCLTGLALLLLLLLRADDPKGRWDRALEFLGTAFFSFVTFGYRANALTVLPVLFLLLLRGKAKKIWKSLLLLAILLGILMTAGLPRILGIHSQSVSSVGIVWEMLTAIQRIPEAEREPYLDYLDELGGEGVTRAALEISNEETSGSFTSAGLLGPGHLSAPGATLLALRKYFRLMLERPVEWFSVKRDVILRSLGIGKALDGSEYSYNRWDAMGDYGFNDSRQRHAFVDSFLACFEGLGFYTRHPWVPFLLSLLLVLAEYALKRPGRGKDALLLWTAAFYYLAYLLDTPAYDFRYFYPSLWMLMILDGAVILKEAGRLHKKISVSRRKR